MSEYEVVETPERAVEIIQEMLTFVETAKRNHNVSEHSWALRRYNLLGDVYDQVLDIRKSLYKQKNCVSNMGNHSWRRYAVAPGSTQKLRKCTECGLVEVLDG